MTDQQRPDIGTIGWIDLTVPDAVKVRDFYSAVVGWQAQAVSMGDYEDFGVGPTGSEIPVAGICHAKGMNSDLPAHWLIYIIVSDLEKSIKACLANGGKIIRPTVSLGEMGSFAVIEDPAGAVAALYQKQS